MAGETKTIYHFDESASRHGKLIVQRVQDMEPAMDHIQRLRQLDEHNGRYGNNAMHLVASIPVVVIEAFKNQTGIDLMDEEHEDMLKHVLNHPDMRKFRVREGII